MALIRVIVIISITIIVIISITIIVIIIVSFILFPFFVHSLNDLICALFLQTPKSVLFCSVLFCSVMSQAARGVLDSSILESDYDHTIFFNPNVCNFIDYNQDTDDVVISSASTSIMIYALGYLFGLQPPKVDSNDDGVIDTLCECNKQIPNKNVISFCFVLFCFVLFCFSIVLTWVCECS
jgi:hypothetical protein